MVLRYDASPPAKELPFMYFDESSHAHMVLWAHREGLIVLTDEEQRWAVETIVTASKEIRRRAAYKFAGVDHRTSGTIREKQEEADDAARRCAVALKIISVAAQVGPADKPPSGPPNDEAEICRIGTDLRNGTISADAALALLAELKAR
jgi:hypothetical protein